MLRTIDLRGRELADYSAVVPRGDVNVSDALTVVAPICAEVARDGIAALRLFSKRFDHCVPVEFRIPQYAIDKAVRDIDPRLGDAIVESIRRRRAVCEQVERSEPIRSVEIEPGAVVSQRVIPVNRVGLYVPGGLAPLASSVLMNVIPAQVAGVSSIAVTTPPQRDFNGLPHPTILAVCGLLGVDEVYAVGGAQAVAMFAYGVEGLCRKVDVITGPGNIYVAAAKRYVRGCVGIDAEAGPTEIAILADDSASPAMVAADLISQAEHDPMAGAVLVTSSTSLAEQVRAEIETRVPLNPLAERLRQALSGAQSAVVLVKDLDQGIDVINDYAAEHLEIHTHDANEVARRIRHAGAIFIGPYAPVPLGDYAAGSTHVLPTGGAARFSSGLTVRSFERVVHVVDYSAKALDEVGDAVCDFAHAERLPGHAASIEARRPFHE